MTAAQAAASIAAQAAAAQAAYNAGTLTGPGINTANEGLSRSQLASMWQAQGGNGGGLIAGGGNGALTVTGLQAGYYRLPGATGAEYYDPSSGQASAEFISWANSATQDELSSAFIPVEGGPQSYADARAASLENINNSGGENPGQPGSASGNFNAELNLVSSGDTGQQAQDAVLGIGSNQQFVIGANGQRETVGQASGPQAGGGYRDVSTYKSGIAPSPVGTVVTDATGSYMSWSPAQLAALDEWYAAQETDTSAAVAANSTDYQSAEAGLQQENVIAAAKAAGIDPGSVLKYGTGLDSIQQIADTGISAAQTQQIQETYNSIQDPAEAAAYIAAQDPGNLTASERVARTAARAGQTNWMTKNVMAPTVTYQSAAQYDNGAGGGIKTTYGDVTQTSVTTGRSIMYGNVVTARSYVGPAKRGSFDAAMQRIGGGIYGAFIGFIGSFGNPIGAVAGAAQGSGLVDGIKISFKDGTKNIGKSGWGTPESFSGDPTSVVLSLGEAMAFSSFGVGGMGLGARVVIGAGMGTVNGFLSGGVRGAEFGGVVGGVGGALRSGVKPGASYAWSPS